MKKCLFLIPSALFAGDLDVSSELLYTKAHVEEVKEASWDVNFRLGAGYNTLDHDYMWRALWTRIDNKAEGWTFDSDVLDISLAREMETECVNVSPHIAVRFASLKQKWKEETQSAMVHFRGVGPQIGCSLRSSVSEEFGFFVEASASILWGYFELDSKIKVPVVQSFSRDRKECIRANTEARIGIDMQRRLVRSWPAEIRLRIGYEGQVWQKQMERLSLDNMNPHGDLSIHGAFAQMRIFF